MHVATHIEMVLWALLATCVSARVSHEPVMALEATLCEKYVCNDDTFQILDTQCIYYDAVNITYVIQGCSNDTINSYCPPSYESNSTCTVPPEPNVALSWPGEYCLKQNWCKYGYCVNNTCVGQVMGAQCEGHGECNPGLRCLNNVCQTQLQIGDSGCETDQDCVNNAGCDADTCRGYFTIPSMQYVGMCENSTSLLCETGFCYFGTCLDPPLSQMELPVACVSQFDCLSNTHFAAEGIKFYTDCVCGYNSVGQQYCEPFIGDDPMQPYLDFLRDWLNNTNDIMQCNTARRLSSECVATVQGNSKAQSFMYYQILADQYPMVVATPACALDVFFPQYATEELAAVLLLCGSLWW